MRALRRGATGIVTDGGVRDSPSFGELDVPTYYQAPHAAVLGLEHFPLEDNVPVTCAGVLVMPGDVMVGDAEGVLVIPAALAEEVALDAARAGAARGVGARARHRRARASVTRIPIATAPAARIRGVARAARPRQ